MERFIILITAALFTAFASTLSAQTIQDSGYRTVGHIKSDGTVQDSGYRTIGHIKSDGTVQDAGYRTIGHANGISREWAALYFFFM